MSLLSYKSNKKESKILNGILDKQGAINKSIIAKFEDGSLSPLEFLLDVINDPEQLMNHRISSAKSALPYIHQQLPSQVELSAEIDIEVNLLANDAHRQLDNILFDCIDYEEVKEIEHKEQE